MSVATAIRAVVTWLIVYVLLVLVLSVFGGLGRYEVLLVALVSAVLTVGVLRVRSRSAGRSAT